MPLQPPVHDGDHQQGSSDAPVTLVHYGDFQCPYSGASSAAIRALQNIMGAKLRYVFRPFPLTDVHPQALHAALAAESAANQDQFWPMYDLLFNNQRDLRDAALRQHAQSLGLDVDRFARDMENPQTLERVQQSIAQAKANGAHGTPTFFVNGEFHDNKEGLWSAARLRTVLESALPSNDS